MYAYTLLCRVRCNNNKCISKHFALTGKYINTENCNHISITRRLKRYKIYKLGLLICLIKSLPV